MRGAWLCLILLCFVSIRGLFMATGMLPKSPLGLHCLFCTMYSTALTNPISINHISTSDSWSCFPTLRTLFDVNMLAEDSTALLAQSADASFILRQ